MSNAASEAKIILDQLTQSSNGSGRLQSMIGAKDIGYSTNDKGNTYVTFKFKGSKRSNACTITLTGRDDYDMTFWKLTNNLSKEDVVTQEFEGLDAIQIKDVFEEFTGLYLSL